MTSGENHRLIKEGRGRQNFQRKNKAGTKKQGRILIITEGEKTEPLYLEKLCKALDIKLTHVDTVDIAEIVIEHIESAPKNIVEGAIKRLKRKEDKEYFWQKVYCVFDRDQHSTFQSACEQIKDLNKQYLKRGQEIRAFVSDICFEVWLLAHYLYSTAQKDKCDDVIKCLKNVNPIFASYHKGKDSYFEETFPLLAEAKKNMVKLREHRKIAENSPYSDIDLLIDELIKKIPEAFYAKSSLAPIISMYKALC